MGTQELAKYHPTGTEVKIRNVAVGTAVRIIPRHHFPFDINVVIEGVIPTPQKQNPIVRTSAGNWIGGTAVIVNS